MPAKQIPASRPFHRPSPKESLFCGKVALDKLARRYGTPLYVNSADQIVERYRLFEKALAGRDHMVCFAMKANSSQAILKLLAKEGAGFDIVSGGELERVLRAAPEAANRVVFSGVGKTAEEIDKALLAGIFEFNVESAPELELLGERAKKLRRKANFALRVNPDVSASTHPYISTGLREHKFGVSMQESINLYKSTVGNRWLEPHGISVHIGSQICESAPFGAAMERVAKLVRQLAKAGIELASVDAGGGLGIEYEAAGFDAEKRVQSYIDAVTSALDGFKGKLLFEPGRFLVAQAGALVARVVRVKKNGRKSFVILDAAMTELIRPALYQAHHEIVPIKPASAGRPAVVDVVGPVCESGDFLALDRKMPALEEGDLVAILDAGAYGMTQSSNYNTRLRPAEVLVQGAKAQLIRRRETIDDLLATEIF